MRPGAGRRGMLGAHSSRERTEGLSDEESIRISSDILFELSSYPTRDWWANCARPRPVGLKSSHVTCHLETNPGVFLWGKGDTDPSTGQRYRKAPAHKVDMSAHGYVIGGNAGSRAPKIRHRFRLAGWPQPRCMRSFQASTPKRQTFALEYNQNHYQNGFQGYFNQSHCRKPDHHGSFRVCESACPSAEGADRHNRSIPLLRWRQTHNWSLLRLHLPLWRRLGRWKAPRCPNPAYRTRWLAKARHPCLQKRCRDTGTPCSSILRRQASQLRDFHDYIRHRRRRAPASVASGPAPQPSKSDSKSNFAAHYVRLTALSLQPEYGYRYVHYKLPSTLQRAQDPGFSKRGTYCWFSYISMTSSFFSWEIERKLSTDPRDPVMYPMPIRL